MGNKSFILGIDLGKDGGFCLLDSLGEVCMVMATPEHPVDKQIDHYEIEGFLAKVKGYIKDQPIHVAMERVWAQKGSSAKSMYSFGHNNGYVKGLVHMWFGREIDEIVPVTWQKWLFKKTEQKEYRDAKGKRDTKRMAKEAILKLYPNEDFRRNKRCSVPHGGIVDAVGIALYAKEKLQ